MTDHKHENFKPKKLKFRLAERISILRTVVGYQDEYVDIPAKPHNIEKAFWKKVFEVIVPHLKAKIGTWHGLKSFVLQWSRPRRERLMAGKPLPISESTLEFDEVVDQWNSAWSRRFSRVHWRIFDLGA